ncbi:pyridoxamine kinase [Parasporobacterium paucivorans]|uniref:pyridoxal kinase n=1 Tax=Parasporobacterium paucivorans DSM 15970 TaxID=1122934 RepID=A0A1M6AJA3_9FIRM|nr:pyridoxamine kinase [Parasporobacterium paucivorans]SHI36517.1 pyridoxine kinase [Parasporobacterium paucivorans DSM 15970]
MSHNNQKKIAVINDLSGFGRCSLMAAIPVISHLKVQCCAVPTAILSNHTGFDEYFFDDYTEKMQPYVDHWKKLNLEFEGITSGFLGSVHQVQIVKKFIRDFKTERTQVIIDPVMGDYGHRYPTCTNDICSTMSELVEYADIMTPNLTEACILTDTGYHEGVWRIKELEKIAETLCERGPDRIVITGILQGQFISNMIYCRGEEVRMVKSHRVGTERSGTGDIFTAVIAADAVNGVELYHSVRKASTFVKKCILRSIELDIPKTDGVCFEEMLQHLK